MNIAPTEIMITGRLVRGHPMNRQAVVDDKTKQPKLQKDGVTPRSKTFIHVAIPKGAETDWKQTEWGQVFNSVGIRDWPNGEHAAATFAWKVFDGDSQIPNKEGNKPADQEGYPGHWIVNASTELAVRCHHVNKYDPHEQIQDDKQIKCGDYCRVLLQIVGNGPSQSPGIYVNPVLFELSRAGVEIITASGPSAASVFGNGAPAPHTAATGTTITPPPAQAAAPAPGTIAPAPEFLTPPPPAPADYNVILDGNTYSAAALKQSGWTDDQLTTLQRV